VRQFSAIPFDPAGKFEPLLMRISTPIEELPDDVHIMVHICQGNCAVGPDYDGQIGRRSFDLGRYKADLVCQIEPDGYVIEPDMTSHI
jgi:hypothetical protein